MCTVTVAWLLWLWYSTVIGRFVLIIIARAVSVGMKCVTRCCTSCKSYFQGYYYNNNDCTHEQCTCDVSPNFYHTE